MVITFTTSENQKNNTNNNISTINLGECETLLRNYYNISKNETLYMKKIDIVQEGMKTSRIEYDVYSKLSGNNLVKLNLTVCGATKIVISLPLIISDSLDKLNISSGYYNDICYTITSEDGTDVLLKDRQKEFINNDNLVCQEDCDFSQYDYETFKAKCSCDVKETPSSIADMSINKEKLLDNFKNIKNIVNFDFLICYKKLLKIEGIIYNIGCYILLVIILFHIISIFIFYINQFPSLKKRIQKISIDINEYHLDKGNKNIDKKVNKIKIYKAKKIEVKNANKIEIKKINKNVNKDVNKIIIKKVNKIEIKKINKKGKKNKPKKNIKLERNDIFIYKKGKDKIKNNIKKNYINKTPVYHFGSKQINPKINMKGFHKIEKIKNIKIKKLIDEEINELSYYLACQYDKRTYCGYYISLLKTKHNLIFAFFNHTDYNSGIIKLDLFFISFAIDYILNAFFYNDDTMHKIYESKGQFDLTSQLPIIIYSYIISIILNAALNFLALSNDIILGFKQFKYKINLTRRMKRLKRCLSIKFLLYFIISFLFLLFFWYYISIFGVIYKNTQIHLLKDTLMSFGLSLIAPFLFYLLPGMFRIPSLYSRKRKCLYDISRVLQSF